MQPGPAAYEERYRFTATVGWVVLGGLTFVLIGILIPMPLVIQVLVIGFFGWCAINTIAYAAIRKVALRVDHAGVTLGGIPYRYKATTRFFPWADIEKIVLWERMFPMTIARWTLFSIGPLRYIGMQRRAGAPPLSRSGTGMADKPAYHYSLDNRPPVPGIAGGALRNQTAWRLDNDQLTTALATCAPTVQLVNATPATTGKQREDRARYVPDGADSSGDSRSLAVPPTQPLAADEQIKPGHD